MNILKKIPFVIDTEFIEKPGSIELISIGIVSPSTGDLFYRVCNDFNFDEVWNDNWLRENVLKVIFNDFVEKIKVIFEQTGQLTLGKIDCQYHYEFNKENTKLLIDELAVTKKELNKEIIDFINKNTNWFKGGEPSFFGWYAAYDWVVFCWIFGRMIDLPEHFPMFINDIKQLTEELGITKEEVKANIPANKTEHHALSDAIWESNLLNYVVKKIEKANEKYHTQK